MRTVVVRATLLLFAIFSAIVPFTAEANASPGAATHEGQNQAQTTGASDQQPLSVFAGKIVSLNGSLFILRDDANQVWYHLDDQAAASKFAGKVVNVRGRLDGMTGAIRVQSIEEQKSSVPPDTRGNERGN